MGLAAFGLCAGCASLPEGQPAVVDVELEGNVALSDDAVLDRIATKPGSRFLGLFPGFIYDYRAFNERVLARDLERVERLYQAHGFYAARVKAGRIQPEGDRRVRVQILVEEGPPVLIDVVRIVGTDALAESERSTLREVVEKRIARGSRLVDTNVEASAQALLLALQNHGYARAKVTPVVRVDVPRSRATVVLRASPGRLYRFGPVRLVGLGSIPREPVLRAVNIAPGARFSRAAIDSAQDALVELGVFSSVSVEPELGAVEGDDGIAPVVVRLAPAALRTFRLGGGVQLDALRADVHADVGWQHQNFLGGLRRLSVSVRPALVLYPTRVPTFDTPERVLPAVATTVRLEQPGVFEARTLGFSSAAYDIYPVLLKVQRSAEDPIVGYREFRGTFGVSRAFKPLRLTPRYGLQADVPFTYRGSLNANATSLYISYIELLQELDWRNDRARPTSGEYLALSLQFAGLGGDARDLKVEPQGRIYVPISKSVTWTSRALLGFLFPLNYQTVPATGAAPSVKDTQIAYFRAFFSGGPSSNRGYPYRSVGPHGAVAFFSPSLAQDLVQQSCDLDAATFDAARCSLPLGGPSLWEASTAVRMHLAGAFFASLFCDASDVASEQLHVDLRRPHVSCGFGPRYETPVGAIRVDVAYRVPGLQTLGPATRNEGQPGEIFGLPINVSLGLGEAY
jgi:outer membrane protein insertion porin family/translocation and assembly module TamA